MKLVDTFHNRLELALKHSNMKQIDLVKRTGLDKTLINKYLAGAIKARQDKLTLLADALNVNEVWLMGYDVPMERTINKIEYSPVFDTQTSELLTYYEKLNERGRQKAVENTKDLTKIAEYTEKKTNIQEEA